MEEIHTQNYAGKISDPEESGPIDGYVSPDVAAARAGETVDFSKPMPEDDTDA